MDTTTSIKMTTLAIQKLFGHVEEENLTALRDHLDRFKEVDGRSDVRAHCSLALGDHERLRLQSVIVEFRVYI